ncbi:MAG: aminopeptidase [Candidatus Hydrothermarchaeales archaeon]
MAGASMLNDVLKTCLDIKEGETVLIVTDYNKMDIASRLEEAAKTLSNEVIMTKMKPRAHHAEEPPKAISEAMKGADVVIIPTTMSLTHTDASKNACEAGARLASMPGITMQMLTRGGMSADYDKVKEESETIAKHLSRAEEIKIKTSLGSDFTADLKKRKGIADAGILDKKGMKGNLPGGEGFIAPLEGRPRGKLVFDGSFASLGLLKKPMILEIKNGLVTGVEGFRSQELLKILEKYKNAENVAEIGIGTNSRATLIGNVLEDEKVYGTIHIAFGDNHTFGGAVKADVHLDGIITKPNVWLDDEKIIEEGEFLCFR